ncbi:hypothetical protein ACJIZ3_024994 [Penstemon smallii]|uniref:AT3G52170-like helix-turn-helix domain-containing protein n=1 Tax=Penstemon smallii TaxID=265156 RepID=A0ABD3TW00_9LAMI
MRLIQPANISLSRHFRWRQVIRTSNESSHSVLTQTHNLYHGSDIKWRGRSFAATPVPSDTLPEERKAQRRVSKHERISMVENFVNKYRETNAGKFPTASMAQKEVGGSFYFLREIIQELKYNSQKSPTGTMDTTSMENGVIKKDEISTHFGEVSQLKESDEVLEKAEYKLCSQTTESIGPRDDVQQNGSVLLSKLLKKESSLAEAGQPVSKAGTVDSICKSLEPKKGPLPSISFEERLKDEDQLSVSDKSKYVTSQSHHLTDELKGSLHSDPQTSIKQETSEDKVKFERLQPKAEPQQSSESEISERELHKVPTEAASQQKSSMWQNLKSFANGIFNIWRR